MRTLSLELDKKMTLVEQDQCLSKLPYADGANFDSYSRQHEPHCLPETRIDLLYQLEEWSGSADDQCIYWLNGMAGSGKSTVARTVARVLKDKNRLGGSFFFSRDRGDLSNASRFFSTLAIQLTETSPALKNYIVKQITENKDVMRRGLRDQWEQLVFRPLLSMKKNQPLESLLILVIDALDECENQEDIRLILELFAQVQDLGSRYLKVLVTSRPETPIRLGFANISKNTHKSFILHNISQPVINHDLSTFFNHELNKIKRDQSLPKYWPGEQKISLLVEKADRLFIYAATVCRFIGDPFYSPEERLSFVLQSSTMVQSSKKELDKMYTQVLKCSIFGDSDRDDIKQLGKQFRRVVGPIVILLDSLSTQALSDVLAISIQSIKCVINPLTSVLDIPENEKSPVRLLHPSFPEFLLDRKRCLEDMFWIPKEQTHNNLVMKCLQIMSKNLKRDICSLRWPGTLIAEIDKDQVKKCLSASLQYACRYWVNHLQQAKELSAPDYILRFLHEHFLHWLEVLSLMNRLTESINLIIILEVMSKVSKENLKIDEFSNFEH